MKYVGEISTVRDELVTKEDLQSFKADILGCIQALILANSPQPTKKWMKSYEVMRLLGISKGTLQTLRDNGTLTYTRIGRPFYYDADEIQKLLAERKGKLQREAHPSPKR